MSAIGDVLRQRRKAYGLTMRQVLSRGGPCIAFQSDVEKGKRQNVSVVKLIAWCNAIGCEPIMVFADIVSKTKKKGSSHMQEARFPDGSIEQTLIEAKSEEELLRLDKQEASIKYPSTSRCKAVVKSDLVDAVSLIHKDVSRKNIEATIDIVFDCMTEALTRDERIEIRGFGSFTSKIRDAREGRNPRTGEKVSVPRKRTPLFTVGKELKERIGIGRRKSRIKSFESD